MSVGIDRLSADTVFKSVAVVAARGLKLVRLYGITTEGACECGTGRACTSPGKHPRGNEWHHRATTDENEIQSWFDDRNATVPNVGVLLGPAAGVIDVECDGEQAEAAVARWGLGAVDTPAFQSGRGVHRLFRWDDGLPDMAVVKVDGIEVRLGGGGKAAQSVIPPSWHASGVARDWLPGRTPDDCDLQPLPEAFKRAITAATNGTTGGGRARRARAATAAGAILRAGEGRHEYLHGEAVAIAQRTPNLNNPEEIARIRNTVHALNSTFSNPPYPAEEVARWVDDAIRWVQRARDAGVPQLHPDDPDAARILAERRTPWERMGLVKNPERPQEYEPGEWRLTVRHSDPKEYVIEGVISPSAGRVTVALSAEEFLSPTKTAHVILATSGDVDVMNPNKAAWSRVWAGYTNEERNHVKGLKCKLLDECQHEYPPAEYQRHATLAAWMLDYMRRFKKFDDVTEPSIGGGPRWLTHNGKTVLAFRWEDAWRKAAEQAGGTVTTAEVRRMSARIRQITGEEQFGAMSRRGKDGSPGSRFTLWDERHIRALEQLAGVESAHQQ